MWGNLLSVIILAYTGKRPVVLRSLTIKHVFDSYERHKRAKWGEKAHGDGVTVKVIPEYASTKYKTTAVSTFTLEQVHFDALLMLCQVRMLHNPWLTEKDVVFVTPQGKARPHTMLQTGIEPRKSWKRTRFIIPRHPR